MFKQNVVIYSLPILYDILKELENELNYNIIFIPNKTLLDKIDLSSITFTYREKN